MQKHTKVYMDYFGYDTSDFIPCELCGMKAVDINHIKARGMGGSEKMDHIENLMAMCRLHHQIFGDVTKYREFLIVSHFEFMRTRQPIKTFL